VARFVRSAFVHCVRLRFVRGALDKFPECEIGKTDTCNEHTHSKTGIGARRRTSSVHVCGTRETRHALPSMPI
jgi:hypothetical protein